MANVLRREKRYCAWNWAFLFLAVPFTLYAFVKGILEKDSYVFSQALLGLILMPLPFLSKRLFHFALPQDCCLLYRLFVFGTVVLGSAFRFYYRLPYWDKAFHFLSGVFISAAGFILCIFLLRADDVNRKSQRIMQLLLPFLINLSVAALWEVYEYLLYIWFGIDAVNTLTTGVNDTMQDIIVCLLGGLLFLGEVAIYQRWGKQLFFMRVCRHYFEIKDSVATL